MSRYIIPSRTGQPRRMQIDHVYNSNEYTREGRNGRLYSGVIGWRYYPSVGGNPVGDPEGYKTKAEAMHQINLIREGR